MQSGFYDKRKIDDMEVKVEVEICHVIIATCLVSVSHGKHDCNGAGGPWVIWGHVHISKMAINFF